MLIKTNKKKSVFSKAQHVEKFSLSLDPEYIEKIEIFDEEIGNAKKNEKHIILVKVPIDKVSAILNKAVHIEGFACKDFDHLRTRLKTLSGFSHSSAKTANFAIANQELLSRDALQGKIQNAAMVKIFGVDIASRLFANIKISDVVNNKKPYIDIFGYEETIELQGRSAMSQNLSKNKNRKDLFSLRKINNDSGEIESFKVLESDRLRNLSKNAISKINFKREFNRYLRMGLDPGKLISNSFYTGQSLDQMIKGRIQKNMKSKETFQNFGNKFHQLVEISIPKTNNSFAVKKIKVEKTHEVIEVKVNVPNSIINNSSSNTFDIVVFAKDDKKRILDYYTLEINLDKLKKKKSLIQKSIDLKKHGLMCQRSKRNKAVLKISNNTDSFASYSLLNAEINTKNLKSNYFFESIAKTAEVGKNKDLYVFSNRFSPTLSSHKGYFYRMKVSYPEMMFDNTFFDNIAPVSKGLKNLSSYVDIVCINDDNIERVGKQESVNIKISNFPFDCIALNIVKRNLTKKEKNFKIIKNFEQESTNLQLEKSQGFFALKQQQTIFFNKKSPIKSLMFTDNDIEEGDVYEYKVMIYRDNCETEHSINSYELKYEKRQNIIDVKLQSKTKTQGLRQESFVTKLILSVSTKKDAIDKLFDSIDRNSYELFSEEFDNIKESLSKNISCSINLINTGTGERLELGSFVASKKEQKITVEVNIDNILASYVIEVIPRIASTSYIVESLLTKIELLPNLQSNIPISSFLRILTSKRNKDKKTSNLISKVPVSKYTGKSVRFFGLILDPVTRFNQEKDDFYFEGSTGDTFIFNVYSPNDLNNISSLKLKSITDLSHQIKAHGNNKSYNKMAILDIKSNTVNLLVNFYAIYAKTNGTVTFLGMISPEKFDKKQYNFFIDLENTVGIVEMYCVTILKDGTFLNPTPMSTLLCTTKSIKAI